MRLPEELNGCRVLDLDGDCSAAAAARVGPKGEVLALAASVESPARRIAGTIEIPDASIAVITAARPVRSELFAELWRLLEPGGELLLPLIVTDRRWPDPIAEPLELEGVPDLKSATYLADLRKRIAHAGFSDHRIAAREHLGRIGEVSVSRVLIRAFKLPLEEQAEDYGQVAIYDGAIDGALETFELDLDHRFEAGRMLRVSRNTAQILTRSRYARHFSVSAEEPHRGPFELRPPAAEPEGAIDTDDSWNFGGFAPGELELDSGS